MSQCLVTLFSAASRAHYHSIRPFLHPPQPLAREGSGRSGHQTSIRRSDNRDPFDLNVKEERQGQKHGAPSPIRTHDWLEDFTPGPVEPGVKERKRQNRKQRDHGEVVPGLRAGQPTGERVDRGGAHHRNYAVRLSPEASEVKAKNDRQNHNRPIEAEFNDGDADAQPTMPGGGMKISDQRITAVNREANKLGTG